MNAKKRQIDRELREIASREVEKVKARCRDIFYESMRQ